MDIRKGNTYYVLTERTTFSYLELRKIYNAIKNNSKILIGRNIPSSLSFIDDDYDADDECCHAFIEKCEIIDESTFEKEGMQEEKNKYKNPKNNEEEDYKIIYIKFEDLDKIAKLVLKPFLCQSKDINHSIKLVPNSFKEDSFTPYDICMYEFDIEQPVFENKTDYSEKIINYLTYYENKLNQLDNQTIEEKIEIDLDLFRQNFYEFSNLINDETMLIIPLKSKIKYLKSIVIEITEDNKETETNTFFDISASSLSKENNDIYRNKLREQKVILSEDTYLSCLSFDNSQKDYSEIKNILSNEKTISCNIYENIESEKIRIKRIIKGINKVIDEDYEEELSNSKLIDIICSNDLLSYILPSDLDLYEENNKYIEYLSNEYPKLKGNKEQLTTIDKILQMDNNDIPIMLVQGPPGTGKTELILSLARELSKKGKNTLITSNVQVACDNVVDRLKNHKEIILKRYGRISKAGEYSKQITQNQKNYMVNQVLSSYEFKEELIDSEEKINFLKKIVNVLTEEINRMSNKYKEESTFFQPFINLVQQNQENYKNTIIAQESIQTNEENKINLTKKIEIIKKYNNELISKIETQNNVITKIIEKKNTEHLAKKDIELKLKTEQERQSKIEKTKEEKIQRLSNRDEIINDLTSKINTSLSEYNEVVKINLKEEYEKCLLLFEKHNNWQNTLAKYFPEVDHIIKFYLCRKRIMEDSEFCNNNKFPTEKLIIELYYNKNNLNFVDNEKISTSKNLEILTSYLKLSWFEKIQINRFNKTIKGINKELVEKTKKELFDHFKHIQYNYKTIILELFNKYFPEVQFNALVLRKNLEYQNNNMNLEKFKIEIDKTEDDIKSYNKEISIIKTKIAEYNNQLSNIINKIISFEEETSKQQKQLEKLRKEYSQKDNEINELITKIKKEDESISKTKEYLNLLANHKEQIKIGIEQIQNEYGERLNNFISFDKKYRIDVKNKLKEREEILNFIANIENKLNITNNKNNKEVIFNYAKELKRLKNIENIEDPEISKFLSGKGSYFRNAFNLESKEEYNLISMTTNQVAQLLRNEKQLEFDYAIVDEASKCTFEDLIISLPHVKHLILIGDYMQLNSKYDKYKDLPLSTQTILTEEEWISLNESPFSVLVNQLIEYNVNNKIESFYKNPFISSLKKQYRMNKGIYNLIAPIYSIHKGFEIIDEKNNEANDIKCIDIKGQREEVSESSINWEEVLFIVKLLNSIQQNRELYPKIKTIGVISGYRAQVNYIRSNLKRPVDGLEIGSFDRFQGKEYDLVIVSMVRTDKLGFLSDIRRMNVAFSRAKQHLIIVGNFDRIAKIAENEIINKHSNKEISYSKQIEEKYVCNQLIPTICSLKEVYPSDEERITEIHKFLKENNYE